MSSLESFGIIGLLNENSKIYYDSIFTSRHVGRVTDLLSAQFKTLGVDELRFRVVLTFSLYEAYRCQISGIGRADGESLAEPLVVECGSDDEKIAIGVSLVYPESEKIDAGLLERITSGQSTTRFERFVAQMIADTDQVIVRVQPESRRVEVVSLLGLPGKAGASSKFTRSQPLFVSLRTDATVSGQKGDYIELGDVDYHRLLAEDRPGKSNPNVATGEILAKGGDLESEASLKIKGTTDHLKLDEEVIKISEEQLEQADEVKVVEGMGDSQQQLEVAQKRLGLYQKRMGQLQSKIESLQAKQANEVIVVKEPSPEAQTGFESEDGGEEGFGKSVKKVIRSIFGRGRQAPESAPEAETASSVGEFSHQPEFGPSENAEVGAEVKPESLLKEQVERLEATIAKMKAEAQHVGTNPKAKKWADGMVGELLAEKARINEMAKKLSLSTRQKEFEFKSKESRLNEELRRKEEQLRQKSIALERAKEQISQLTVAAERTKTHHNQGGSEEGRLNQKLAFTQKLLQGAKEENFSLAKKIEELKNQVIMAQNMASSKQRSQGDQDLNALKSKFDRVQKQNDEFKRANQMLMEKLNEIQRPKAGTMSSDELKKKLETAMRLAANYQKDSEQLRLKVEELQKEDTRLKAEVNRLNNALNNAVKSSKKSGGGQAA